MKSSYLLYLFLIMLTLPASNAIAQESAYHPSVTDRFTFSAGAFRSENTFKIRAEGTEIRGDDIDFGNSIGVEKSNTLADVQLRWKFGHTHKWSLAGQYFSNDSTGRSTLDKDVQWQDLTFREGSFVNGGVGVDVIRLFLGRSLVLNEQHDFGVGLGIHHLDISAFIGGDIMINDVTTGYQRADVDASGILPNLGTWYNFSPARQWLIHGRLDWISADIDEYDGSMWNTNVGVTYQPWRHIGFDLSYQYFNIDLNVDEGTWNGGVDMTYSGPVVSMTANW